jgi:hypothetical protein
MQPNRPLGHAKLFQPIWLQSQPTDRGLASDPSSCGAYTRTGPHFPLGAGGKEASTLCIQVFIPFSVFQTEVS